MLITLDDIRVTYNTEYIWDTDNQKWIITGDFTKIFNSLREQGETFDFGLIAVSVESEQSITFATSHNINTSQAMYRTQNVITSQSAEPITFNLTLCPVLDPLGSRIPQPWTNEMWTLLYKTLDTRDYKPLIFGDPMFLDLDTLTETNHVTGVGDKVSRPYYNCIPLVGSVSELKMFENSQGYVTIPFTCDAPHMWIDVQKTYHRGEGVETSQPWYLPSYCNVKDYSGLPTIYPTIIISDFQLNTASGDTEHTFISLQDREAIENNEGWFCLYDVPVDEGTTLYIDGYNKTIYGTNNYTAVTPDGTENPSEEGWYEKTLGKYTLSADTTVNTSKTYYEEKLSLIDENYYKYFKNGIIRFLSFVEMETVNGQSRPAFRPYGNITGGEQIYHKTLISHYSSSYYTIKFFYSCPYMGGNVEADSVTPGNGSVMLHTNEEGA